MKSSHSGTCLPFDAFTPLHRKINLIRSEFHRAKINSSNSSLLNASQQKITNRFLSNGYPTSFIDKYKTSSSSASTTSDDSPKTFLRVPFFSEKQKYQIFNLLNATNLRNNFRIIFTTEASLAWQFRPKHQSQSCSINCISCKSASFPNNCFIKCAVYLITCLNCNHIYIGQTAKCMKNRIYEHLNKADSLVNKHFKIHNSVSFKWKILATESSYHKRCILEANFIKHFTDKHTLINGCVGRDLTIF